MRHFQGQVGAWIGIGICFFLLVGTIAARTATEGSLAASAGEQMTTDLYQQAAKIFLPAAFYEQEDESAVSWLLGQMQHVLPVYAYMGERRQTAGTLESSLGYYEVLAKEASDEAYIDEDGNLISAVEKSIEENEANRITINREKLMDYDYLVQNFYRIDRTTTISSDQLNAAELLAKDLTINTDAGGSVILIYHTHSQEGYADSDGTEAMTVVGLGDYLATLLQEIYGIPVLHDRGQYDLPSRDSAYSKAEPAITQILKDNPSIQVVIDLHRDGVAEGTRLVSQVNGKDTAKIMFFNGLSRTTANGDISYLPNPYIQDNLAFSLQMQLAAAELYPDFTRPIYLKGYRYNMHLCPKSLLVEVGAQTNTFAEAKNAMEPLAHLLAQVLLKQ
ncbi:MAG TPA: stage II sporulation protein P [Candidatus Pullilachnospira gallistercoris]|uniref:Stage II sporulation protein P n=1 Tax=Candidatus Pullilachnospira gallistercoris TaxID=2840911 RepID=A0A9D1E963_9FIRM|nr:stage II sporulation protein P [Candidatus Pullilachnospira gallistercoris]